MMSDVEKALRVEAIVEIFLGCGAELTPERLRIYGNNTQFVPIEIFQAACRAAVCAKENGYPPSVGEILKEARELAPAALTPGQPRGLPRWYRRQLGRNKQTEQPREIASRSGSGCLAESVREVMR